MDAGADKESEIAGAKGDYRGAVTTRTATEYNNKVAPGMDALNVNLIQSNDWMQDIQAEIDREWNGFELE